MRALSPLNYAALSACKTPKQKPAPECMQDGDSRSKNPLPEPHHARAIETLGTDTRNKNPSLRRLRPEPSKPRRTQHGKRGSRAQKGGGVGRR